MKTLVIGCTGMAGGGVVRGLLDKDVPVRCMSHSPNKIKNLPKGAEGFIADLDKPDSLARAMDGVDKLFLVLPVSRNETAQGLAAVGAARASGVRKIAYLSVFMPEGSDIIPHFNSKIQIEDSVKASGIPYTILRPNNFFQNDLAILGVITGYGIYPTPIGSIGLNRVDVSDVAECAVNALTQSGHEGRIYPLHGPDTLNGNDMARIYSKFVNRDVRYAGNDLDAWVQHVKYVMPEWLYRDLRVMYKYFQEHGMIAPEADLEKQHLILGRPPRTFEEFAEEAVRDWRVALAAA